MRTLRQRRGAFAEDLAVAWLTAHRWTVVARNLVVGRDEIDVVALDPAAVRRVVCVEVRSARSPDFGTPEERVDARKVGSLYRAARAFSRSEQARELGVGGLIFRVDLLVVDVRGDRPKIRHLPELEPA